MNQSSSALATSGYPQSPPLFQPAAEGGGDAHKQVNILALLHRALRGRYLWAIGLATVGAVAGAAAGYLLTTPKFEARGLIKIDPVLEKLLIPTEQSEPMQFFVNYVNLQAQLIRSERVVQWAMTRDPWRGLGPEYAYSPETHEQFDAALNVGTRRETPQLIEVRYQHAGRDVALTAVREVIQAYYDLHGKEGTLNDPEKVRQLEEVKRAAQSEVDSLQASILAASQEYGTADLSIRAQTLQRTRLELEDRLRVLEAELRDAGLLDESGNPKEPAGAAPESPDAPATAEPLGAELPGASDRTPEVLAQSDREMADLLSARRRLLGVLEQARSSGMGDKHAKVRAARADLDQLDSQISLLARALNDAMDAAAAAAPGAAPLPIPGAVPLPETPAQKLSRYKSLVGQVERVSANAVRIGNKDLELQEKKLQLARKRADLAQVEDRLRAINVEGRTAGRVEIVNPGSVSTTQTIDSRKKLAAAGLVVGGGLPFGLFILLGLADRRFRYCDDARDPSHAVHTPLLGVLPQLPENLADSEQAAAAAHSVHQIRLLLGLGADREQGQCFMVSSPTSGDGKTSLVLSLGLSFAGSGARTLLIDLDMVGGGLSSNMGYREADGVLHAMDSGGMNGTVKPTTTDRLWIIPTKRGDEAQVGRVAPAAVKRLIAEARKEYDVVIVDTGPVFGSLEAAMVAKEADGVVLVVGRGQHRATVERAIAQLHILHAKVRGLVFNRALTTDFRRSVAGFSFRSIAMDAEQTATRSLRTAKQFGPMPALLVDAQADPVSASRRGVDLD